MVSIACANVYVTQRGYLYLADQRITWIRYFKTVQRILSIFAYHNEHIYVYVFVCFVFVIEGFVTDWNLVRSL